MKRLWFRKKGDSQNAETSLLVDEEITIDELKEKLLASNALPLEGIAKSDIDFILT
jgi:hypothetical protein